MIVSATREDEFGDTIEEPNENWGSEKQEEEGIAFGVLAGWWSL